MASETPLFLGIECGGTRTVAIMADAAGKPLERLEAGPANLRLVSDALLAAHFRTFRRQLPPPSAIGVGMAGARDMADRGRVARILDRVWPGVPARIDHDLETVLAASGPTGRAPTTRVVIVSGTGSCCYGRNRRGTTAKVGGWGHQLGDRGSGYDIAFTALRAVVREFDHTRRWSRLGRSVLRRLQLNEPEALIPWLQQASKSDIAALAPDVFAAAARADPIGRRALDEIAGKLADDADACARRLATRRDEAIEFIFAGSVLLKQPAFAQRVGRRLRQRWPHARVSALSRESAWGAVALAAAALAVAGPHRSRGRLRQRAAKNPDVQVPVSLHPSPTEQRNPRSLRLDRMPLAEAVALMIREDSFIARALRAQRRSVERVVGAAVAAFRRGGRLFYVGAGTSGRLGVLDASECPPTFRTPPGLVQGIIAGGAPALVSAVEGAEDDVEAGARAIRFRGIRRADLVVGLTAGGRTPFVWGALDAARKCGATTALICCNPHLRFRRDHRPDVVVALDVGPEILTGSTRLKAGTATKLVLNMVTTLAMVKLGKVASNLMVDVNPSNTKLRDRAVRIVRELTGVDEDAARAALQASGWVVRSAVKSLGKKRRPV